MTGHIEDVRDKGTNMGHSDSCSYEFVFFDPDSVTCLYDQVCKLYGPGPLAGHEQEVVSASQKHFLNEK